MEFTEDRLKEYMPSISKRDSSLVVTRVNELMAGVKEYSSEAYEFLDLLHDTKSILEDDKRINVVDFVTVARYISLCQIMPKYKAWQKAYPDRYELLLDKAKEEGRDEQWIRDASSVRANNIETKRAWQKIKTELLVPDYLKYMRVRDAAIQKNIDLMNGKAPTAKKYVYEKEGGKFVLDKDGRKVKLLDIDGNPVVEEEIAYVSPLVQMQASHRLLDMTDTPMDTGLEIKKEDPITSEAIELAKSTMSMFSEIAENQRQALINGADINKVQQIGNVIEAKIIGDDEEEDEQDV